MSVQDFAALAAGEAFLDLPGFAPGFTTTVKLEGLNVVGSIKLKTARGLLDSVEEANLAGPGAEMIESTSGNLGVALAALCAARGYRITLVTDPNTSDRATRTMRALGAQVVRVEEHDANGGYLQTRIDYITARLAAEPRLIWLNQYANPANADAHRRYTTAEILAGFGVPDWLFVGIGTGGTLMGCVRGLHEVHAPTVVVGVDSVGSVIFGGPAGPRWIPGVGGSRRQELVVDDGSFIKVVIAEADAVRTCRRIARDHGVLLGGSSGTVLAAVRALRDRIPAGSRVLVISPDLGGNYLDTIYDDGWVLRHFSPSALDTTDPLEVRDHAASEEAIRR
jgi:cysteine synthase A